MINCDKFVSLITDYLDGTLGEQEKAKLKEHLLTCKECASVFERIKTLRQHLKKLPPMKTSPVFEVVLKNRLRRELGRNRNWNWLENPWTKVSVVGLSAAAIFLVAFFSLHYSFTSKKEQRLPPAMLSTFQTSTNKTNPIDSTHPQIEEKVFFVIEEVPADLFASEQQYPNLLSSANTNGDSVTFSLGQIGYQFYSKSLATVTF